MSNGPTTVRGDATDTYLKWFESTDLATLPRGPVHPAIPHDRSPKGDSPEPSELRIGRMRMYE